MMKLASLLLGVGLMFASGAASAAEVKVHLGFATYDPLTGKYSDEQYNYRLPNKEPRPFWVRSGTTVAVYVHVDFLREGSANGQLSIEAKIVDHDDGFIIPGIDDELAGPLTGAPIPEVGFGGKDEELQVVGPFLFYVERADVPGIRNVYSTPADKLVESGLALEDFEWEDQADAQTLEIVAPVVVTESGTVFDSHYPGKSVRFYLSVLTASESPLTHAKPGAFRITAVPEPSTGGLLLAAGAAGWMLGLGPRALRGRRRLPSA